MHTWASAGQVPAGSFGDPTGSTDVSVCMIDTGGATPRLLASLRVAAGAGWRAVGTGFTYKAVTPAPGQVDRVRLVTGPIGKISARGLGPKLRPGRLPVVTPLHVQVVLSEGTTTFGAVFERTRRNWIDGFDARLR